MFFSIDNAGKVSTWIKVPRPYIPPQFLKFTMCCGSLAFWLADWGSGLGMLLIATTLFLH